MNTQATNNNTKDKTMFFIFLPSDNMYRLDRPTIIQAKTKREAENMFDENWGYYPDAPRASYDSLVELVDTHDLRQMILAEKVDVIGFGKYGTDSDEFAFIFE